MRPIIAAPKTLLWRNWSISIWKSFAPLFFSNLPRPTKRPEHRYAVLFHFCFFLMIFQVSPLGWESGGLRQPSAKNSSKSVFGNGEVKEGATIEQLMSLASAPLTPAASRPKDVSGAFARKNTAEIAQKAGKVAVQSPGARHTVAFGERPKWEQSGALDVPRFDFDQTFAETSESRPAAGQRGTVSFEPQQLQKLVELERMKESAQSLFANHSPNDAAPPIALAAPAVEAASVECHSKTWEVPRRGPVSLKVREI